MSTHFHLDPVLISRCATGLEQLFYVLQLFQTGYLVWMPYHNFFLSIYTSNLLALHIHYRTTLSSCSTSIEEMLSNCFPCI